MAKSPGRCFGQDLMRGENPNFAQPGGNAAEAKRGGETWRRNVEAKRGGDRR